MLERYFEVVASAAKEFGAVLVDTSGTQSIELPLAVIALFSAAIGALVTKLIEDRKNSLKYITEERQNWRTELRKYTDDLYAQNQNEQPASLYYQRLRAKFEVRLNPRDSRDKEILRLFDRLIHESTSIGNKDKIDDIKSEIVKRIACLLKFDWERAKMEAGSKFKAYHLLFIIITTYYIYSRVISQKGPKSGFLIEYFASLDPPR